MSRNEVNVFQQPTIRAMNDTGMNLGINISSMTAIAQWA
ncbi:MAG: hypothetical protein ACD_66C00174G0001, partial [uncultured bacterium]